MTHRVYLLPLLLIGFSLPASADFPRWVNSEGESIFEPEDKIHFRDASNLMHGIFGFAGLSRDSEVGHENFRPDLAEEPMADRARLWLRLVRDIDYRFNQEGKLLSAIPRSGDAIPEEAETDLAEYPHGVYVYHMHHRGGRWEEHGLERAITYASLAYQTQPGIYLMENHFHEGRFYHDRETGNFDKKSMAHGLAGMHAHVYAWVRWAKPDGEEDMGQVSEEHLVTWLEYSADTLVEEFARPAAEVLTEAWDSETGIYHFDEEDTWSLQAVGSLLRGVKAVYETLYMFGEERDRERARELAGHAAEILKQTLALSHEWGIPEKVRFTGDGAEAASDIVDTESLWSFVSHLGNGFGLLRENEGMSDFVANGPLDVAPEKIGETVDSWLLFLMERGLQDDILPAAYSYEDGSITDERHSAAGIGMFVVAAANNYRHGNAFERASDWDEVDEPVVSQSRNLYNALLRHSELLETVARNR